MSVRNRRRMGRIRTHPARQRRLAAKSTANQIVLGRPVPATQRRLNAVPKLARSWLESVWSDGAPFKDMAARHVKEAAERKKNNG